MTIRAAQYVRMSTEHQQYSTENQGDVIREYAAKRGMEIVRTFADSGKSGLRVPNQSVCVSTEGDTTMAKKIDPLQRELLSLDEMSVGELVEKFRSVFGKDTRTRNRPYLVRKIAWRLQERAEGGLSDRAKARVAELAATAPLRHVAPRAKPTEEAESDGRDPRLPKPGTVIRREYNGKEYAVTVHETDFEYRGKRYASLSKIAKDITGTHWNGWLFFNLATRKRGAAA